MGVGRGVLPILDLGRVKEHKVAKKKKKLNELPSMKSIYNRML